MPKNRFLEPYIKENNLLQLSLFSFDRRKDVKETHKEWLDENGVTCSLTCSSRHGVPGSREQDVFTACMRVWVKNGMKREIRLNYADIAKELKYKQCQKASSKIKKSLKRLGAARYELVECFISVENNEKKKITTQFSLFDATSLFEYEQGRSKKDSCSVLIFSEKIRQNLEAKYYQYLDMAWYRSLPEGLSRRLYEYLTKRQYHKNSQNIFAISEDALCRWLPINDDHITNRRRRVERITKPLIDKGYLLDYFFNKTKKQCVFTYAVNAQPPQDDVVDVRTNIVEEEKVFSKTKELPKEFIKAQDEQLIFVDALDWINSIPYFQKKKRQEIASLHISVVAELYIEIRAEYEKLAQQGKTPRPGWVYTQFIGEKATSKKTVAVKKNLASQRVQVSFLETVEENSEEIEELIALLKNKRVSQKLRRELEKYCRDCGFDYVRNSILYANQKAKKNYSSYLQQTLSENWAEEWVEVEKPKLEALKKHQLEVQQMEQKQREEAQIKLEMQAKAEKQRPLFQQRFCELEEETKIDLWKKAKLREAKPTEDLPLSVKTTHIQLAFAQLVLDYFNQKKEVFVAKVVSSVPFVKELTQGYSL